MHSELPGMVTGTKVRCSGRKADRQQCSRMVDIKQVYCFQHEKQRPVVPPPALVFSLTTTNGLSHFECLPTEILHMVIDLDTPVKKIVRIGMLSKKLNNALISNVKFWTRLAEYRECSIFDEQGRNYPLKTLQRMIFLAEPRKKVHYALNLAYKEKPTDEIFSTIAAFTKINSFLGAQYSDDYRANSSYYTLSLKDFISTLVDQYAECRKFHRYLPYNLEDRFVEPDEFQSRVQEMARNLREFDIIDVLTHPANMRTTPETVIRNFLVYKKAGEWRVTSMPYYVASKTLSGIFLPAEAFALAEQIYSNFGPLTRSRLRNVYNGKIQLHGFICPYSKRVTPIGEMKKAEPMWWRGEGRIVKYHR